MRPLLLALALTGCATARAPSPSRAPSPGALPAVARAAPAGSAHWMRVAPRDRPLGVDRVASLDDGRLVLLAGTTVLRVGAGGHVETRCELDPNQQVRGLHASGDRWWAVAGEMFDAAVWRGGPDGTCVRSPLPLLVARDAPPGRVLTAAVGEVGLAWSSGGPVAQTRDAGATWRGLPPLPEIVAATVDGRRVYAAALVGSHGGRAMLSTSTYELYAWSEGEPRWSRVAAPGDRAEPVALLPRDGGGVVGIDAVGRFDLDAGGTLRALEITGPHFARDRPSLIAPLGPDAAVGLGRDLVYEHRGDGWRPLPPLPDRRRPVSVAALPDGSLAVSDRSELWRVRSGAAPELLLGSPLGGREPLLLAAASGVIAVVSMANDLAVTRDDGLTWTTVPLPRPGERCNDTPRALAAFPSGVVAALTLGLCEREPSGALWVSDGGRRRTGSMGTPPREALRRVELPSVGRALDAEGVGLYEVGDRWLLLAGDVYVSDDRGGRWRRTLSAPAGVGVNWSVTGLAVAERAVFALDVRGVLWRSDDAGDEFTPVGPAVPGEPLVRSHDSSLSWDGSGSLLSRRHGQLVRYDREGRGEALTGVYAPRFATLVDGAIVFAGGGRAYECPGSDALALLVSWEGHPSGLVAEACQHPAVAFARDGDDLYLATGDGAIERASLSGLLRELSERDAP